jgi:hypothetical protein
MGWLDLKGVERLVDRLVFLQSQVEPTTSKIETWIVEVCGRNGVVCEYESGVLYGRTLVRLNGGGRTLNVAISQVTDGFDVVFTDTASGRVFKAKFGKLVDSRDATDLLETRIKEAIAA